jgi:hypothetical protein
LAARNGEAEFGALWLLRSALDSAIVDAYDANRDRGVSLEALAAEAGTSRQALAQWCARRGSSFEAAHAGDDEAQRSVAPDQALEDEGGQEASDGL